VNTLLCIKLLGIVFSELQAQTPKNYFNQPTRNPEHAINGESQWLETVKKLDSKLQKQRQGWPKISTTAGKYNKVENLKKLRQRSSNVRGGTFWATIG